MCPMHWNIHTLSAHEIACADSFEAKFKTTQLGHRDVQTMAVQTVRPCVDTCPTIHRPLAKLRGLHQSYLGTRSLRKVKRNSLLLGVTAPKGQPCNQVSCTARRALALFAAQLIVLLVFPYHPAATSVLCLW